jgi:hypothetical protein
VLREANHDPLDDLSLPGKSEGFQEYSQRFVDLQVPEIKRPEAIWSKKNICNTIISQKRYSQKYDIIVFFLVFYITEIMFEELI